MTETIMQQAAKEWEALCTTCDVLGIYVENVEARDDRICYTFDGYIHCVIYYIDGFWVEVGDCSFDASAPDIIDGYKHDRTLQGVYEMLRDEMAAPPDFDVMGAHMGRNA